MEESPGEITSPHIEKVHLNVVIIKEAVPCPSLKEPSLTAIAVPLAIA
jgi:hypothetical protein